MSPAHSALACPDRGKVPIRGSNIPALADILRRPGTARCATPLTWQIMVAAAPAPALWPGRRLAKIGQLTDVSHCKLQQYLCCNRKIACQST